MIRTDNVLLRASMEKPTEDEIQASLQLVSKIAEDIRRTDRITNIVFFVASLSLLAVVVLL